MSKVKERYVTDEHGHKVEVIIPLHEYKKMVEHLEDVEDALELEKAVKEDMEFESLENFLKALKKGKAR